MRRAIKKLIERLQYIIRPISKPSGLNITLAALKLGEGARSID